MKTTLAALSLALLAASCSNEGTVASAFAVQYVVESTGGAASVTQIDYTATGGGTVMVSSPTLPWTITASFVSGDAVQLNVTGSTGATSTVTARIQDDPGLVTTPTTYASGSCPENTNPCTINLTHTF
ncbi:MAG: hypothetical protein H6828_15020 [Planctomycetes bacterium]|nr:hypothetical protein [Planctomycetota bacterium]